VLGVLVVVLIILVSVSVAGCLGYDVLEKSWICINVLERFQLLVV
jgi:hypothetical protein